MMYTQISAVRTWLMAFLLMGLALSASAQTTEEAMNNVTRTFALTNARIVQAPGRVIENGTVLVRDGRIMAVGSNVNIPYDAETIDGEGLSVYAGFIDGLSNMGMPRPRNNNAGGGGNQEPLDRGNPSDERAGIQPERNVVDMIDPSDKSIADMRKAGFTAAHTVPHGRMLPGQGALVLTGGMSAEDMLIGANAALYAQFIGAGGVYPGTPMAIMAKWRDLYHEAQRRQKMEQVFADNPSGTDRPEFNAALYAFFPVLDGALPVMFRTETWTDIYRALRLQDELGFPMVLADIREGWVMADQIKNRNIPVFLSLQLPKEVKADDDEGDAPDMTARTISFRDVEAEVARLKVRQAEFRTKYESNAAMFEDAGVRFGFAMMGARANDVQKNLRRMVTAGLSEDRALAALTTDAAALLGVDGSMGTVDTGKMANLVVTTAPYFSEDAQIKYVFVDGYKYAYEVKEKKASTGEAVTAADGGISPLGTWDYSINTPGGAQSGQIIIESDGSGGYTGILTSDDGSDDLDLDNIAMDGDQLSFTLNVDAGGQMMAVDCSGTIDGDDFDGEASVGPMGTFPLTATRTSKPGIDE